MLDQSDAITVRVSAFAGTQPDSLLLICKSSACTPTTAAIGPAALVHGLQMNSRAEDGARVPVDAVQTSSHPLC